MKWFIERKIGSIQDTFCIEIRFRPVWLKWYFIWNRKSKEKNTSDMRFLMSLQVLIIFISHKNPILFSVPIYLVWNIFLIAEWPEWIGEKQLFSGAYLTLPEVIYLICQEMFTNFAKSDKNISISHHVMDEWVWPF